VKTIPLSVASRSTRTSPLACLKSLAPLLSIVVLLGACASRDTAPRTDSSPLPNPDSQLGQAVTTPLSDLNLVKADIPLVLAAAQKGPYDMPTDRTCSGLAAAVRELDAALGADLDTPPTPSNPSLIERAKGAVEDAAVGAVRGAAEGVVPYRSWVRKLSGAERYSKDVAAAIAAGTIRRAFLKGLGQAAGCEAPAAPRG